MGRNNMKTLLLAALLVGGSALAAHAESFTFKANSTLGAGVQVMGEDGKPIGGGTLTGTGETVMASGKHTQMSYICEGHTALPGGIFESLGVCTVKDDAGAFYELYGCNPTNKTRTETDCWAGMVGTDGAYKGQHGTNSWHSKDNADGKTSVAWGQGGWND
jgi:hypothetical protein